jgi:hypothetical protein
MRITVHLSTFDETNPCAYAILWIDRDTLRWSRESHFGLALPEWGVVRALPGTTLLNAPHDGAPLCELDGLDLVEETGPFEGETGGAHLYRTKARGHWHVQCIDEDLAIPEHGLFADDEGT